jgi:hypothetical protein
MCKAHFSTMDLAKISLGVSKATNVNQLIREVSGYNSLFASRVNHREWFEKHKIPAGFAPEEEELAEEGSPSSFVHSDNASDKDSTYHASGNDKPESSG